jgi:hypothetical protein
MLAILRGRRKLRLFAICCCHRLIPLFPDLRACVEAADQFADGHIGRRRLRAVCHDYLNREVRYGYFNPGPVGFARAAVFDLIVNYCLTHRPSPRSMDAAISAVVAATCRWWWVWRKRATRRVEELAQCQFLREILGPFHHASFDDAWRTPRVVTLAQAIYDGRTFDRLPELADGLEEAGCADDEILAHCRSPGPHVRGCWVLDLILGKE